MSLELSLHIVFLPRNLPSTDGYFQGNSPTKKLFREEEGGVSKVKQINKRRLHRKDAKRLEMEERVNLFYLREGRSPLVDNFF